jgi:hypothetical protein
MNKRALSEEEIDERVIAQADDDSAWEEPVKVRAVKSMPLALPAELVVRAAFCARLSRAPSVGEWLRRIVQERIELEEAAFAQHQRRSDSDGCVEAVPSPRRRRAPNPKRVKSA